MGSSIPNLEQHLVIKPEALKPSVAFDSSFANIDLIVGGKGFHQGIPDAFHALIKALVTAGRLPAGFQTSLYKDYHQFSRCTIAHVRLQSESIQMSM
jgi:hypothetical protein